MKSKLMKSKLLILAGLVVMNLPLTAQAHRLWLLPAATVLSGEKPWVTVDAAVSNDIFYFNHHSLKVDSLKVTAPDGSDLAIQNVSVGKHRTVFDLELTQGGTYKLAMASAGLQARWETEEGERRFWPGRGETPAPGEFDTAVPKDAKNLKVSHSSRRMETFITAGAPTESVLEVTGKGLEMQPLTHPNDLYNGEEARFRFLMDGEPTEGVKITLIRDGSRYRNSPEALELVTGEDGLIVVEWSQAGMYWLEAEYEDDRARAPATLRKGGYIATLEVLPQ
jgi:uncharacterized GH25 family protein